MSNRLIAKKIIEWKSAPCLEGRYEVSNVGEVRSLTSRPRTLKQSTDKRGYKNVSLNISGRQKNFRVHRLVLLSFNGDPETGQVTRHLDGNPANNCLENLKWGTVQENSNDKKIHGTVLSGEKHGRSKLTESQVLEIFGSSSSLSVLAKRYNVSPSTIAGIRSSRNWSWLTKRVG